MKIKFHEIAGLGEIESSIYQTLPNMGVDKIKKKIYIMKKSRSIHAKEGYSWFFLKTFI